MATPATARRSEPLSTTLDPTLNAPTSPLRTTHQTTSRASTPRPSISPLSTASRPNRSPELLRNAALVDSGEREETGIGAAINNDAADLGDDQDDDRSSSLSEPEDEPDEENDQDGMTATLGEGHQLTTQRSLDVDSEAETERLEQTPQKLRKHANSIGKTPSKLSHAATAEDELSDPPSPLPTGAGVASSTSTVATEGKKRKRSDSGESSLTSAASDLGESPRKRSHESPVESDAKEIEEEADANAMPEVIREETVEDVATPEEPRGTPLSVAVKGFKGKKGKQKGRKPKETVLEPETGQLEAAEGEQEPSEETAAKTEEQRQQRAQASSLFDEVAKQFIAFREKLYNERLATITTELNLLNQPDCQHPEYLRQIACVNAKRDKQIREANAHYYYRMQSIRQRTLGERSQLHSQYFQQVRELRENVLYALGEDWYNIQKERRQQYQEQDEAYVFKFPAKRSAQIRQQAKYNQEVSVLSGVAKYVGFPAAPEIGGAEGGTMEVDLKAMKIPKRVPQPTVNRPIPYGPSMPTVTAQNERLAHEQFIEQNAWAQPQRPIQQHGTPNLTHTPDWAEPGPHPARTLIRNLNGQLHRTHSPFTTPMSQKRMQQDISSSGTVPVGSDGVEPPSSVLAAPPTSDRMHNLYHGNNGQGSPLVVGKHRQSGTELTGFRNVSNMSGVSGASTIDAPPDSAEKEREQAYKTLPALLSEASAPQQAFDTSQLHRHDGGDRREVYPAAGFRPQEGAFGTPVPLEQTAGVPPG